MNKQFVFIIIMSVMILGCEDDLRENSVVSGVNKNLPYESDIFTNCVCEENKKFSQIFSCDTILFMTKSMLYWQLNCDSSWLTFEDNKGHKLILNSKEKDLIPLSKRLGMQFNNEYSDFLLFDEYVVAGCCDYPASVYVDKITGNVLKKVESFNNIHIDSNYLLCFTDSDFNQIELHLLNENKKITIKFPGDRIETTLGKGKKMYPYQLFESFEFIEQKLNVTYKYLDKNNIWKIGDLFIDIKNNKRNLLNSFIAS